LRSGNYEVEYRLVDEQGKLFAVESQKALINKKIKPNPTKKKSSQFKSKYMWMLLFVRIV
jgi:hypothetical protein